MKTKKVFILIISTLLSGFLYSQDILILTNNQRVKTKIVEVTDTEVKYRLYSNLEGPIQIIKSEKVYKILYENGVAEIVNGDLSVKSGLFGLKYYKGNQRIRKNEFILEIQENEEAYQIYKRGNSLNNASNILGIPSGLVFGWNIGRWIVGEEASQPITTISGIIWGGALILHFNGLAKVRNGINKFNDSNNMGLHLKLDHNGVGLVLMLN